MLIFYLFVSVATTLFLLKPIQKPVAVPDNAVSAGPNDYMKIWTEGERVCINFRNMPTAKVMFDKRVCGELSERLKDIS